MALAVHGFGIKNDASVRFTQRDGYPLGLGFQFISERNGTVKAGVVPGVAGAGAALVHQHNQGILVTVNQDLLHFCTWPLVAPLCQISWRLRE